MNRLSMTLLALSLAFAAGAEAGDKCCKNGEKTKSEYRWGKTWEYPLLYAEACASPQWHNKSADHFPHHPMDGKRHWHNSRLYVYRRQLERWELDTFPTTEVVATSTRTTEHVEPAAAAPEGE